MAGGFLSGEEAAEKLGLTAEQLKELVRDGRLREFRDAGKVHYKADEVEKVATEIKTDMGSASGELVLEPVDDISLGSGSGELSLSDTGSDMLSLDDVEMEAASPEDEKEGTVVTSVGISVFDDDEVEGETADPQAKTVVTQDEGEGTLGIEGVGSGSGLLDLSRERDATSLGAELLDEIYPGDESGAALEMGEATRAGLEEAIPETPESSQLFEAPQVETAAAPTAAVALVAPQVEAPPDALSTGLTAMMIVAAAVMCVLGLSVAAMIRGVWPTILDAIYQKMGMFGAGAIVAAGIALGVGFFLARRSGAS